MKKESAEENFNNMTAQPEYYPIFSPLGPVVTSEQQRKMHEAQDRIDAKQDEKEKNKRPPKPPSRPNAYIGGLAIENA
jgi:hypothetical protein